jgi:hypothetical protein
MLGDCRLHDLVAELVNRWEDEDEEAARPGSRCSHSSRSGRYGVEDPLPEVPGGYVQKRDPRNWWAGPAHEVAGPSRR